MKNRSLFAILFALAGTAMTSAGQSSFHPFTFDEIHKVTLLFVPEPQATVLARSLFDEASSPTNESRTAAADSLQPLIHSGMQGVTFTPDMLALLSLLSDETNRKVESYLQSTFGRPMTVKDRADWAARRDELRNAVEVKKWLHAVGSDADGKR